MSLSLSERIPVEIWEKILYHATRSPLLPFTEDGELTPDLVDNLLL
ncbi:6680_t:CDS:1, partial [Acaulospora colombiana]